MALKLRQSTEIKVRVGPFRDYQDGVTMETSAAVVLASMDEAELLKANGAATVSLVGATFADVTGCPGWFDLTLTAAHTDTVGELEVVMQDADVFLPVSRTFQVVEESIYDALYAASAAGFDSNQRVDVGSWLGTSVTTSATTAKPEVDVSSVSDDATAADNLESAADNYSATRGLAGTALPAAAADAAGGLPISDAGGLDVDAIKTATDLLNTAQTEPTGVPAANETPMEKIGYLFMAFRNKLTVTASKKTYFGDDDVAEFEKDLTDDATTYTESEINSI